jgi:N-glycosylase/DNA lyase
LKNSEKVLPYLKGVRFGRRKSKYITEAVNNFDYIYSKIVELRKNPLQLREWLAENVKGYGYKEASHFLRNIGLGENLAILDVHILRKMAEAGLIRNGPNRIVGGISGKRYKESEQAFFDWAKGLGLKPAELDISIWLTSSGNTEIM